MGRRAGKTGTRQEAPGGEALMRVLGPMVDGLVETKRELLGFVQRAGLTALSELLAEEAEVIAGPKGKHQVGRSHHHWGRARSELILGGRKAQVQRPRVRARGGEEVTLPSIAAFRERDPLAARVLQQVLLGVSSRGYAASLEPVEAVACRGTSKSAASRVLVGKVRRQLTDWLSRPLDEVRLVALVLDGLVVSGQTLLAALGITREGTKIPLGLWQGSTENATVATALLQDLLDRGLRLEERFLCILDGSKGLRKAVRDVFGETALVQRCQLHKRRNVLDYLPKSLHRRIDAELRAAYASETPALAEKRLRRLAIWLEREGHAGAAASVREGLEETLTVLALRLPATLRRSLASTNTIENLVGSIRKTSRNVKRWRKGDMVRRWAAMGILAAASRFRRIKGYAHLPVLLAALRTNAVALDRDQQVA